MKKTNHEMLLDVANLDYLTKRRLPIRVSYAIAKNISNMKKELETYEEERQKLINKYGKKDDKGNIITDKKGQVEFKNKEKWTKDIEELLSIEVDIDIHKFNIKELEGYDMSVGELMAIEYMIE